MQSNPPAVPQAKSFFQGVSQSLRPFAWIERRILLAVQPEDSIAFLDDDIGDVFTIPALVQNRKELDLTDADALEDDAYPSLSDITLESVPAVRIGKENLEDGANTC
jgi:hypothetical protein